MEEVRGLVFRDARCGFNPASVHLTPSPNWAGPSLEARLLKETSYLRGCSVLHPAFHDRLRAAVARIPWVRSIQDVSLHEDNGFQVSVEFRRPVARLFETNQYVDIDGVVLPETGILLDLPWIKTTDGAIPASWQRRVAVREVAFLLGRTAGKGFLWKSLNRIEVVPCKRLDGEFHALLTLVFHKEQNSGDQGQDTCCLAWGRGMAEFRPGDLDPLHKLENLENILNQFPGWQGISSGGVAFRQTFVRRDPPNLIPATALGDGGYPSPSRR